MNRVLFSVFMAFAICIPNVIGQDQKTTTWRGFLEVKEHKLRLEIVITENEGALTGILHIIGKGRAGLTAIELDDGSLGFSSSEIGVSFAGSLNKDATVAKGIFRQGDQSRPLTLKTIKADEGEHKEVWVGSIKLI